MYAQVVNVGSQFGQAIKESVVNNMPPPDVQKFFTSVASSVNNGTLSKEEIIEAAVLVTLGIAILCALLFPCCMSKPRDALDADEWIGLGNEQRSANANSDYGSIYEADSLVDIDSDDQKGKDGNGTDT